MSTSVAAFFGTGEGQVGAADWTALRDRWEYGHLTRAVVASTSLLALVISLSSV